TTVVWSAVTSSRTALLGPGLGGRLLKVKVPVPPLVEIEPVALAACGPPERVKVKTPCPPVVFLVTTTEPLALLVKLQGNEPPAGMTATHVVNPLGVKLALAPSLTVYVAAGVGPTKGAVPLADRVVAPGVVGAGGVEGVG